MPDTEAFTVELTTPEGVKYGHTSVGARNIVRWLRYYWPFNDTVTRVVSAGTPDDWDYVSKRDQ